SSPTSSVESSGRVPQSACPRGPACRPRSDRPGCPPTVYRKRDGLPGRGSIGTSRSGSRAARPLHDRDERKESDMAIRQLRSAKIPEPVRAPAALPVPVVQSYWTLRLLYTVAPFLLGLDKFFNLLANWED